MFSSLLAYICRETHTGHRGRGKSADTCPSLTLPPEVWLKVLSNLPHQDLCHVALVSRTMYDIATDPSLWHRPDISDRQLVSLQPLR